MNTNLDFLEGLEAERFPLKSPENFWTNALYWANQKEAFCFLDGWKGNNEKERSSFPRVLALGRKRVFDGQNKAETINSFEALRSFLNEDDWPIFGHFAYDLKNEIEDLSSNHFDGVNFDSVHFFEPEVIIFGERDNGDVIHIASRRKGIDEEDQIFKAILDFSIPSKDKLPNISFQARIEKQDYLQKVANVKEHIVAGDLYEMNLCQEFFTKYKKVDVISLFDSLNENNKAPFSCLYKVNHQYLLCGSPERFMKKEGNSLISQPIKGTIRKSQFKEENEQLQTELSLSEKDKAENVMIVDLVRNDLAKSCIPGTIQVPDLFGIYEFEFVNHMVSTVSGQLRPEVNWAEAIRNAFPMGSMTGAPKVMSMELIEQYEKTKRGLYSGSVGWISANGDFDFNVVIRSLQYNAKTGYLSFIVGGAIVADSVPELEYEECLLKAKGITSLFKR